MADCHHMLTDKEKDTLRLVLRGHDAKSMARELGLSVHTINERLRNARRKLAVTSSREAARRLFEEEQGIAPDSLVRKQLGEARASRFGASRAVSLAGNGPALLIGGLFAMSLLFAALALTAPFTAPAEPQAQVHAEEVGAEGAARRWLALLDADDWPGTYAGTSSVFRSLNTQEVWAGVSRDVRAQLGAAVARREGMTQTPPTPEGYRVVTFHTRYANRAEPLLETVTLVQEDGEWKVVGIFIE